MSRPPTTEAPRSSLLQRDEARHLVDEVLGYCASQHAEVVVECREESLTRFANNGIHQNVFSADRRVTVKAVEGRRQGLATTSRLDPTALRETAERARAMARLAPEDPDLVPPGGPAEAVPLASWTEETATLSPEARADGVAAALAAVPAQGFIAAGAFTSLARALAVGNSAGRFAYHPATYAHFSMTAMGADSSGWAERHRGDAAALAPAEIGARAVEKAARSAAPAALEPGLTTVVLEPAAVAELVGFLAWNGLGAQSLQEERSFLLGRIGQRVTGEGITLRDDPAHPQTLGRPFDYEGTPTRSLTLIERGVARAVVHDRRTAAKAGVESTGHAAPPPAPEGPMPFHLVMEPGDATLEEMIAAVERGVLVTRFWYNRLVDERRTLVTGMTRDGTFMIEKGKVTRGLHNLRFNESVIEVLARAERLGRTLEPTVFDWVGNCVAAPALLVRDFHFSGVTRY